MSRSELKVWEWKCEGCGATQITYGQHANHPVGWGYRENPLFSTTTICLEDICPLCVANPSLAEATKEK